MTVIFGQYLIILLCCVVAEVVLFLIRFLCGILPLLMFDLKNVLGLGADKVSMRLWS